MDRNYCRNIALKNGISCVKKFKQSLGKWERKNMSNEKQFNIFEVAKIWKSEEIHTSIIAELINPQSEFHDYGQVFLDLFLEIIGLNKADFIGSTITTEEETTGGRRIDMVISSTTHYIPFEVKIWAKDQADQLDAYYHFAKECGKEVPFIVYLTPTERKPSAASKGHRLQDSDIKCITFEKHILHWLDKCIAYEPKQDVLPILKQLHYNIQKNIVRNYEYPLLTKICENKVLSKLEENKTECVLKYRTYTLKKQGILEIALRILCENENHVKLLIICGVEDNGKPNYASANLYIKEEPEKFKQLMNDTFKHDFVICRDPNQRHWAWWQREFFKEDNEASADFAERCSKGIAEILSNCTNC